MDWSAKDLTGNHELWNRYHLTFLFITVTMTRQLFIGAVIQTMILSSASPVIFNSLSVARPVLPVGALFPMGHIAVAGTGELYASFTWVDLLDYKDVSLVPVQVCVCVCASRCIQCAASVVCKQFCECVNVYVRGRDPPGPSPLLPSHLLSQGTAWSRYRLNLHAGLQHTQHAMGLWEQTKSPRSLVAGVHYPQKAAHTAWAQRVYSAKGLIITSEISVVFGW